MHASPWLTTPQAAMALSVSISTLYRWRSQGLLDAGKHWMRKWPSTKSPVLYHCERVQERMAELTARNLERMEALLE